MALRCLAAFAAAALGWAAGAGIVLIATGGSSDSLALVIFIGVFCAAAWLFVGIPLAALNPGFPTVLSKLAAAALGAVAGALMVAVAVRPIFPSAGAALFMTLGSVAAAVAVFAYAQLAPHAAAGEKRFRSLAAVVLAGGVLTGLAAIPLGFSFMGALESTRKVTAPMTWQREDTDEGVVLRFSEDPDYFIVEYMPGLLQHLEASGKRTIPVEFLTYSDYRGKFKGYSIVKIDGMPYRPDPLGRGRAGEDNAASPPGKPRRHPLDVFK